MRKLTETKSEIGQMRNNKTTLKTMKFYTVFKLTEHHVFNCSDMTKFFLQKLSSVFLLIHLLGWISCFKLEELCAKKYYV